MNQMWLTIEENINICAGSPLLHKLRAAISEDK